MILAAQTLTNALGLPSTLPILHHRPSLCYPPSYESFHYPYRTVLMAVEAADVAVECSAHNSHIRFGTVV